MSYPRSNPRRRWFPWALALTLIVLAGLSAWRTLALRKELQASVATQLEDQLADRVSDWEKEIFERLQDILQRSASNPVDAWNLQNQLRQKEPWFDSLYLWKPRRQIINVRGKKQEEPSVFLFPLEPPSEGVDSAARVACLREANDLALMDNDNSDLPDAYLDQCRGESLSIRMFASSQAAVLLSRQRRYADAVAALNLSGVDPAVSLRLGIQRGLDPYRLVIQRLQRAEYLLKLGREDEGLHIYAETGREIVVLDGPELHDLLQYVRRPIIRELRLQGKQDVAGRLEQDAAQADRRLRAWEEIRQKVTRTLSNTNESPRFIYDQYSDTPFLLFYGSVRNGDLGAALQLDQSLLVSQFLATMVRYREHLVVTDAKGNWVAGSKVGGDVSIQVPFSSTLTHLRVGIRNTAISERVARLDNQWILPLAVIGIFTALGTGALFAQVRADDRTELLLIRQREFTTRVTHELKTPLAGIRVMAENLETGIYSTPQALQDTARAIVHETERLAQRVEEILAVAKERKPPEPGPFDPEDIVLQAIEMWGPRLQQINVALHADLNATNSIIGDGASVRDAVGCLLDNALKYRREDREASVWLELRQDGNEVVIEVTDNGLGVPQRMRRAIFERFVRVEGPHRGKAGGHGLGLAQVKEVAEAHRGRVECWEGVDGGARFVLRLRGGR